MIHAQNTRYDVVIGTAATTATATVTFDSFDSTNGNKYDYACVRACLIKSGDTTEGDGFSTLNLLEGTASNGTFTAVSSSGTEFTAPSHADSNNAHIVEFQVPMQRRQRFLRVNLTPDGSAATTYAVSVTFARGSQSPSSDGERNAEEVVFVT